MKYTIIVMVLFLGVTGILFLNYHQKQTDHLPTAIVEVSKTITLEVNSKSKELQNILLVECDYEKKKAFFQVKDNKTWITEGEEISNHVTLKRVDSNNSVQVTYKYGDEIHYKPIPRVPSFSTEKKLHKAAYLGDFEKVKLYSKKYDVNEKDNTHMTPFLWAAFSGNIDVMSYLLTNGANIHSRRYGQNAIHLAILNDQKDVITFLIENGLDVYGKDFPDIPYYMGGFAYELPEGQDVEQGDNVFHLLSETGNVEIAKLFVQYNELIDEKNMSGRTPLMLASMEGKSEYMAFLLENGAIIDKKDNRGNTALHLASNFGKINSVKELIRRDASLSIQDDDGNTALDTARKCNQIKIVEYLQEKIR